MGNTGRSRFFRGRRHRGQSLVEMALLAPLLFLLAFGVVDLARAYSSRVDTATTVQNVLRTVAATPGATPPSIPSNCTLTLSPSPLPTAPYNADITATLSCSYTPFTPMLSRIMNNSRIVSRAVARTQY